MRDPRQPQHRGCGWPASERRIPVRRAGGWWGSGVVGVGALVGQPSSVDFFADDAADDGCGRAAAFLEVP